MLLMIKLNMFSWKDLQEEDDYTFSIGKVINEIIDLIVDSRESKMNSFRGSLMTCSKGR